MAEPIQIGVPITSWDVGDILAGSSQGRAVRVPGSTSADLKVFAQKGDGKKSSVPFWTSVGSIIPGLAAIATSGNANDLISGTIPPLRFPALTGDITTPGGSLATTISLNAVTNAKAAKMPPMTIKGNNSILASDPKDLTVADLNAMGIGGGGGGSGTVTSVGLSLPAIFSVAGSPITTAGTFTVTLATESANTVWAGPTTGAAAAPTFRTLVAADIPSLSSIYQPIDATLTALSALADAVGFLHNDGAGNLAWSAAGTGTVTSVSVVSANGLAGTVATATTTPAITLSTTITGLLKGNGTAISAAAAVTEYVAPGAVTGSGLTQATTRILGRTTAGTGAIEEITVGAGLTLAAGALTATGGTGDFVGPASATDNAVVRFDGTTGKLGQNSLAIIADDGSLSTPQSVLCNTTNTDSQTLISYQFSSPQYYPGIWFGSAASAPSFSNYTFLASNVGETFFQAAATKFIDFGIGGASQVRVSDSGTGVLFTAGGTNKNIGLAPSGTGVVTSPSSAIFNTVNGDARMLIGYQFSSPQYYPGLWVGSAAAAPDFTNYSFLSSSIGESFFNAWATKFVDFAIGGSTKARLSSAFNWLVGTTSDSGLSGAGGIKATGAILTGTPSGGTAAPWKFGSPVSAVSVFDTANYIQIDIGGTAYKLALVT